MPDWQPYQSASKVEQKFPAPPWTFERTSSYGNLTPARFLSVDPLADKFLAWSPYHYSYNSPVRFIDPSGMAATDFYDEDGKLVKHVDDGSNAKFQMTSYAEKGDPFAAKEKFYQFVGFDESQGGKNEVNLTTAIQEAQQFVVNSGVFTPSGNTFCNLATLSVIKTVESATGTSLWTGSPMRANDMVSTLLKSSAFSSVDQQPAITNANAGGLSIIAFSNPSGSGHLTTFSVGTNVSLGQISDVGRTNAFKTLTQTFRKSDIPNLNYLIIRGLVP